MCTHTHTHTQNYVILSAFLRQQEAGERASMLTVYGKETDLVLLEVLPQTRGKNAKYTLGIAATRSILQSGRRASRRRVRSFNTGSPERTAIKSELAASRQIYGSHRGMEIAVC